MMAPEQTSQCMDWGELWVKELDIEIGWEEKEESFEAGGRIRVESRSLVVLRHAP